MRRTRLPSETRHPAKGAPPASPSYRRCGGRDLRPRRRSRRRRGRRPPAARTVGSVSPARSRRTRSEEDHPSRRRARPVPIRHAAAGIILARSSRDVPERDVTGPPPAPTLGAGRGEPGEASMNGVQGGGESAPVAGAEAGPARPKLRCRAVSHGPRPEPAADRRPRRERRGAVSGPDEGLAVRSPSESVRLRPAWVRQSNGMEPRRPRLRFNGRPTARKAP